MEAGKSAKLALTQFRTSLYPRQAFLGWDSLDPGRKTLKAKNIIIDYEEYGGREAVEREAGWSERWERERERLFF